MENGTWAPMAAKLMRAELEGMKNITVCENVVTIRSAANAAAEAQMDALADEIVAKVSPKMRVKSERQAARIPDVTRSHGMRAAF